VDLLQLVDFEVQLHRDEATVRAGAEHELRVRDARIGERVAGALGTAWRDVPARLASDRDLRARVAAQWLHEVQQDHAHDGERTARALRRAGLVLALVLLLLGAGAARAALHYDGKTPVNVFVFLGVLVVPQIVLLALLLWAMARGGRGLLGSAVTALAQLPFLRGKATATLGALGSRLALHQGVERWFTFALAQRGAVMFNLGALAACLWLVSLTDLAFGWSTTLQLAAAQVHTACRAIAAPWAWFAPDAVPTLELVRDSQWVRMPGRFVAGGSLPDAVARSGRWWSFLVAALIAWGLVPRLLAWSFAAWQVRRAQRQVPFDDARCQALFARLVPASTHWQGPAADDIGLATRDRAAAIGGAAPTALARGATWLLCWGRLAQVRDDLAARVQAASGAPPPGVLAVGGSDLAADAHAVQTLRANGAQRVLLAVAAGGQPTKDILELLRELRRQLGARAHLGVVVVDVDAPATDHATATGDAQELAGWRASIERLADPYLALQRLEVAS
jgi:hypothetical protein